MPSAWALAIGSARSNITSGGRLVTVAPGPGRGSAENVCSSGAKAMTERVPAAGSA